MTDIIIKPYLEGAHDAEGIVVIIDVFRACTNMALFLGRGAERIIPQEDVSAAYAIKAAQPEYILMGEVEGKKVEGFDLGNSVSENAAIDYQGKTVIMRTTAGTRGVLAATNASQVICGCFANATAVEQYLFQEAMSYPDLPITLVPLGWAGVKRSVEDEVFARYLSDRLQGQAPDIDEVTREIMGAELIRRFQDPKDERKFRKRLRILLVIWKIYCRTKTIYRG